MARTKKNEQPGDFVKVTDSDGNETRVTLQSFEALWKDRGFKRVSATASTDTKSTQ